MTADRTPIAAELEFLRGVDSPTIANAIEKFGVRDRSDGYIGGNVRCAFPELGVMVGRALTVTMRNPAGQASPDGFFAMFDAIEAMDGPVVLAIADASGTPHRAAYAGEIMTRLARRLGATGLVTDGALRDLDEVRELGFHYFLRHAVVSHGNFEIATVGEPIELDDQHVETGDLLHGDLNGIVVVPWEVLDGLPEQVAAIRANEASDIDFIEGADFTLDAYKKRCGYGSGA